MQPIYGEYMMEKILTKNYSQYHVLTDVYRGPETLSAHGPYLMIGRYILKEINGKFQVTAKLSPLGASPPTDTMTYFPDTIYFGSSVSIHNEYAILGAWKDNNTIGAAYIFQQNNGAWQQINRLVPHDGRGWHAFGRSVSMFEQFAVVGAPYNEAIYIYELITGSWNEVVKIQGNVTSWDGFGSAVSIHNQTIIVAAGWVKGSAYIFERVDSIWQETAFLIPNGTSSSGYCVAIYNQYALTTTFVFENIDSIWHQTASLVPQDENRTFRSDGISAFMNDKYIIIGDRFASNNENNDDTSGAVYIFMMINDYWQQTARLSQNPYYYDGTDPYWYPMWTANINARIYNYFGSSVFLYNEQIFASVPGDHDYTGAAYLIKNYNSCDSVKKNALNKNVLLGTNNQYLIDYRWNECFFSLNPTTNPTEQPTTPSSEPTSDPSSSPTLPTLSPTNKIVNKSQYKQFTEEIWFWGLSGGILLLILICILIFVIYSHKKAAAIRAKTMLISNPMCVFVAIGDYEDDPKDPDFDGYVNNLDVDIDIRNLCDSFGNKYRYDIYPKYDDYPKIEWTQDDLINLLTKQAKIFSNNVISNINENENENENKLNYDGLLV
eukprot:389399_1